MSGNSVNYFFWKYQIFITVAMLPVLKTILLIGKIGSIGELKARGVNV